jgi:galactokinase
VIAVAPGRVNLIGDHTDYSGGLVCPMAIDLATTVTFEPGGERVELTSDVETLPASVALDVADPSVVEPAWARYVASVVAVMRPATGGRGTVRTTLPIGAGLSSSAALEVAVALALGADDSDPVALARACQRAEHLASGVPCGIMDQLVVAGAVEGHALVIDCTTLARTPVAIPDGVDVVVVDSGERRALATSAYAARHAEVAGAEALLGRALRSVTLAEVAGLAPGLTRRRARHVVSENGRVALFAAALAAGDLAAVGGAMTASHASLRDDFEVSTPGLDALVARLVATPGVWGARLTGAGFGGCVVALTEPGVLAGLGWTVRPAGPPTRTG